MPDFSSRQSIFSWVGSHLLTKSSGQCHIGQYHQFRQLKHCLNILALNSEYCVLAILLLNWIQLNCLHLRSILNKLIPYTIHVPTDLSEGIHTLTVVAYPYPYYLRWWGDDGEWRMFDHDFLSLTGYRPVRWECCRV